MWIFSFFKPVFIKPFKRVKKHATSAIKPLQDRILYKLDLKNDIPVIIYQMGKVGSKSIFWSLSRQYPGVVLHAHYFTPDHTNWRIRRLYRWAIDEAKPLNLISLTREPIGRDVSNFFQNFEKYTGVPYHKMNFSLEELKSIFLNRNKGNSLGWFDRNISENFGIDVYVNPFPKCGYTTYTRKNIRLLVMRSEINNEIKAEVIKDFLNLDTFQIFNRNIGADKEYSSTYKGFKKNVKLPLDYINMICKSKYFNHFYDQDTIDSVKQKWCETK
jgi:hypothetical protein